MTDQNIEIWLRNQFGKIKPDLPSVLRALLTNIYFPEFIAQALRDNDALVALAKDSYRHSNGYDRIQLISSQKPEFGLRLHVWRDDESRKERVHGHPWNFASVILVGSLQWEAYIEVADGEKVDVWEYPRPDGNAGYRMKRAGVTSIKPLMISSFGAGTTYFASHELLHRVFTKPGSVTATLMLHDAGISYPSRVLVDSHDVTIDKEQPREVLSPLALLADLELLQSVLR